MSWKRKTIRNNSVEPVREAALCVLAALAWIAVATPPSPAAAQQVAAFVNGEPITSLDIQHRIRITEIFSRQRVSQKEALEDLINEKVKLRQARRLDVEVGDSEVDREYAAMAGRAGRSIAELNAAFKQAGLNVPALKRKLRADIAWRGVLQRMSPGAFQVRDADVVAALVARGQEPTARATQYSMRQVVFIVPRGSPDSVRAARVREAEALRAKFTDCDQDFQLAREYREVVVMDPVTRISSDLPPRLRELLDKTPDGRMTPPEPTASGIEVVAICGRKETIADIGSRKEIREELLSQRIGVQEKQVLDNLRRQSIIEYR